MNAYRTNEDLWGLAPTREPRDSAPHAVVIGSGFGGLAAAVRLVAKGWRVTVLEKLDAPGGRAYVHRQNGHTFDAGPTIITVPFLFEGRLPDLNLGTAAGASCTPQTQARLEAVLAAQSDYTWVANGRFKGGYITRNYGQPAQGVEAIQLEIAQLCYMDEDAGRYEPDRAGRLQPLLASLLRASLG